MPGHGRSPDRPETSAYVDYESEARRLRHLIERLERVYDGLSVLRPDELLEIRQALADDLERCLAVDRR